MQELVKIIKNEPFTNSLVIAEGTGNQHKNVKELIQKYEKDIKDFGTFSVLNGKSTGGRPVEMVLLNEEQATFLMTLLRNSKLANRMVGIEAGSRENATAGQLNILILIEHIIGEVIQAGMKGELPYKEIYKVCKARIEQFQEIAYLSVAVKELEKRRIPGN